MFLIITIRNRIYVTLKDSQLRDNKQRFHITTFQHLIIFFFFFYDDVRGKVSVVVQLWHTDQRLHCHSIVCCEPSVLELLGPSFVSFDQFAHFLGGHAILGVVARRNSTQSDNDTPPRCSPQPRVAAIEELVPVALSFGHLVAFLGLIGRGAVVVVTWWWWGRLGAS